MSTTHFHTIVVGSGTAAYYAVDGLVRAGQQVAMVDERSFGGTCALRGCQPKKYLVSNAEAVAMASQLVGQGITAAPKTNWEALQSLKNQFLEGRSEADVRQWQKKGVTTFHGQAVMTNTDTIKVNDTHLHADHIVLATGALPKSSSIPGAEYIHDSEYFLNLPHLPKRLLFIGGGYISFEFAHIAIRAGAEEVILMHRSAKALKTFEQDGVEVLIEASKEAGIKMQFNRFPTKITPAGEHFIVHDSEGQTYATDCIIGATGRIPNVAVLEGDHGQVAHGTDGIEVTPYLQSTSNPKVYAIGDCAATGHMLAPVADYEGQIVVGNILGTDKTPIDYAVVPSVVFTIPAISSVGVTEKEAMEQGLSYRTNQGSTNKWPSSLRIGERHGYYKVLIDPTNDHILGAHIVRHNAEEVINIFALAIKHRIKAHELAEFMWAYPTYTSDLKYMVR